ncbi:hypothetical protein [Streptomyces albipurpureus]|uniref:Uncharacterized protein n=1 Tax=Streptomyces albipurpureus TaxID=2897419 RepID=A0ABT0UL12_9ACTN|nr:hypothetical protein [Streptomyces sp. CWNU-1]MCM2389129.1 hypothetical protein [Streptomyces sp. CWNU-1]
MSRAVNWTPVLSGEGRPLRGLTRRLLESVLQGEIADHLLGVRLDSESVNSDDRIGVAGALAFVWDVRLGPAVRDRSGAVRHADSWLREGERQLT